MDINSKIILGQMRISSLSNSNLDYLIHSAIDLGINAFDHADIYGNGSCEEKFGNLLENKSILRDKIFIQSKAGIVPGKCYNNSYQYLKNSIEQILKRLKTDYLDRFLIHRPDVLMEPCEISKLFDELYQEGKVLSFGVSNFNSSQLSYLQKNCHVKLVTNQLQLSIASAPMIAENIESNTWLNNAPSRTLGVLDYCREHDIEIQTWSPLQYGFFAGVFIDNPQYTKLNENLSILASKYNVSKESIAVAWILRLDHRFKVIAGTTNCEHLKSMYQGVNINLTHEEFYALYQSAGYKLP